MIAVHNTFTFFEPRYKFFNLCKWLWRCQDWIYWLNVAMLDIRVRKDKKGRIWFCHGIVDLDKPFIDEQNFIKDIEEWLVAVPMCRIINERGNNDGTWLLDIYFQLDKKIQKKIMQIINKKDWSYILSTPCSWEKDVDCFQKYWNPRNTIWQNMKHLVYSICHRLTLKKYARLHPETQEQIDDETTMYWHDFI